MDEGMLIFISSPFAGNIPKNIGLARKYCRYAVDKGHTPVAPHLLYSQFLEEKTERNLGLQMVLQLLIFCDELWAFGDPSEGMKIEIDYAKRKNTCYVYPKHYIIFL